MRKDQLGKFMSAALAVVITSYVEEPTKVRAQASLSRRRAAMQPPTRRSTDGTKTSSTITADRTVSGCGRDAGRCPVFGRL